VPIRKLDTVSNYFNRFPPAPVDPPKKLPNGFPVLAVGRANRNIELYEWTSNPPPHQTYHGYVLRRVWFQPLSDKKYL